MGAGAGRCWRFRSGQGRMVGAMGCELPGFGRFRWVEWWVRWVVSCRVSVGSGGSNGGCDGL